MSSELHPRIAAALAAAQGVAPYHTLPIAQARAQARAGYLKAGPPVAVGAVRALAVPAPHGSIPVRLYLPAATAAAPLVVFLHGSGFVMLDLDTHDDLCRRMCAGAGCAVASVDYRLAPEHGFPAAPQDCLAATRWLAAQAGELGVDARRFVVAGDSAGGCLAIVTCLRLRDEGGPQPAGQLLFYPVLDLPPQPPVGSYREFGEGFGLTHAGMQWFWQHYLQDARQGGHPHAAPARAPSLAGLPPAFVEVAEFDVLRDEGEAYARRLAASGIAVSAGRAAGMNHGFLKYAGELAEADAAVARACGWLRRVFAPTIPVMDTAVTFDSPAAVHAATGREVLVTDWVEITQERIQKFAEATGDFQWIHVDVARAQRESPYGGTIAHGFLTLSLLGKFYEDYLLVAMPFCDVGINYGLNRVRFTQPVRAGSRVRGRMVLAKVEDVAGGLQLTCAVTVQIDGVDKPALVAESVVRRYLRGG